MRREPLKILKAPRQMLKIFKKKERIHFDLKIKTENKRNWIEK